MVHFARPLAVAVLLLLAGAAAAHAQAPHNDQLKCYEFKDTLNLTGKADLPTSDFGIDPGCKIFKAKFYCISALATNLTATDKATNTPITLQPVSGTNPGERICYKVKCPTQVDPIGNQIVTDQFGQRFTTKFKAAYLCTPAFLTSRLTAANGTVMDNQTGLQWEQKATAVGSGVNLADPHDVDNTYTWDHFINNSGTGFLDGLNNCSSSDGTAVTTAGFAGHCDWRLPTIQELQTIVDLGAVGCGFSGSPCIDPIFGPTAPGIYWSATTFAGDPAIAWFVDFFDGSVFNGSRNSDYYVRAVRTGP